MADVSVKMGVSGVAQFKQGITEAAASVKTLDAALKTNEKQLKATGDKEAFMASQTNLLQGKIEALRNVAKNAEQALKQMEANGVSKTSKSYQEMQRKLVEAQGGILDAQADMQNLGSAAVEAAGQTDKLATSLGGLNKRVSLEQVIGAIDGITGAMEKAAGKAKDLGKKIWENITDSARWSDDIATQAMVLNMDVEDYQKMKAVFDTVGEITVAEWQKAKMKVQQAIYDPTDEQNNILELLGINTHEMKAGKYGVVEDAARDFEDVFWEIGKTLKQKVESGEMKLDLAEKYAQAIFGRGYAGLNNMFDLGKEGFEKALEEQSAASKEAIEKNAKLNDELIQLQDKFKKLEAEVTSGLSPALTAAADTLGRLLDSVLEYLQTPEGQEALDKLGTAVSGLFKDLNDIDPQQVVEGFTGVFDKIIEGVKWLDDNKGTVVSALEFIVGGWGMLKLTGAALDIVKLFEGIRGMTGGGAATAGAAAGASWGAAFAAAVAKVAPWLIGAYELLKPAEGGNDSPFDSKTNTMTNEGWRYFQDYAAGRLPDAAWDEIIQLVGDRYGGLSDILGNPLAINAMAKALYGDHNFIGIDPTAQPDAYRTRINNELFDALEAMGYEPKIEIEPSEEVKEILEKGTIELTVSGDNTGKTLGPGGKWIKPEVEVEPTVPEDASIKLGKQIGPVVVPVELLFAGNGIMMAEAADAVAGNLAAAARAAIYAGKLKGFANGLPWVPFDGYPALLHQGERVLTARENRQYTFNNNTYFGGVSLHNGLEVEALTESIAARNAKVASGYGAN